MGCLLCVIAGLSVANCPSNIPALSSQTLLTRAPIPVRACACFGPFSGLLGAEEGT